MAQTGMRSALEQQLFHARKQASRVDDISELIALHDLHPDFARFVELREMLGLAESCGKKSPC